MKRTSLQPWPHLVKKIGIARVGMNAAAGEQAGRQLRKRAEAASKPMEQMSEKEKALMAAKEWFEGVYDTQSQAIKAWDVSHHSSFAYYKKRLAQQGMRREEKVPAESQAVGNPTPVEFSTEQATSSSKGEDWISYKKAYKYAGEICRKVGKRAAAEQASLKFNVQISASTAQRAMFKKGSPDKRGNQTFVPYAVEHKLEDLCLALRELHMPVYRFMILNYLNTLIVETEIAEKFKHKQVRRDWYYRWLDRATRLKTAQVKPLEVRRAKWATVENVKQHYDVLADVLVATGLAVVNPDYNPETPRCERLFIIKPSLIFSMDETRLKSDSKDKDRSMILSINNNFFN